MGIIVKLVREEGRGRGNVHISHSLTSAPVILCLWQAVIGQGINVTLHTS